MGGQNIRTSLEIRRGDDVSTFFLWPLFSISLWKEKSLRVRGYVHTVSSELTKWFLVGTRITYQATGDAGYMYIHTSKYTFT